MSNPTATDVDLFADLPTANDAATTGADATSEDQATGTDDQGMETSDSESVSDSAENDDNAEEAPVATVAQIPDGAMSVTEFAAHMTKTLMRAKFEAGEDLDSSEYVVPQAVYQTVKAQRDRIPHVIVKGPEDTEGRVYILRDEATEWWTNRKERLANRGQGAARASSRTPEDNLILLSEAVKKNLYAKDRRALWVDKVEQSARLVEKYQGFLNDAKVDEKTIALALQEATDQYNAEKAQKEAEKASRKAKNSNAETTEE